MIPELIAATGMVLVTVFIHAVGLVLLSQLARYETREEQKLRIAPLSVAGVGFTMAVVLGLFVLHAIEIWLYASLSPACGGWGISDGRRPTGRRRACFPASGQARRRFRLSAIG